MFSGEADFEIGEYVNKQKYSIYIHYECFVYIMVKWCNLSELFGKCQRAPVNGIYFSQKTIELFEPALNHITLMWF